MEPQVGLAAGEREQLVHILETRFAPFLEAAAAAVRETEQALTAARERLVRAEQDSEAPYRSDPLLFMRASVAEEVDALDRKTTEKKVRASYRFLLDRAVELGAAEVQRFHDDQGAAERERTEGLASCREAVARTEAAHQAALAMQEQVRAAEQAARAGLRMVVGKLGASAP